MLYKIELFLFTYLYGILGKIDDVGAGKGTYNWWDRLRYWLLVGRGLR